MRRILVPVDGTSRSLTILDDAQRLAGVDGELILMRLVAGRSGPGGHEDKGHPELLAAQQYLSTIADQVRSRGVHVSTLAFTTGNIPLAIDEAASATWADMIACATHSPGPVESVLRGSVAWRVLAHSPVPVLLRHPDSGQERTIALGQRHIMVPLDMSGFGELALPLVRDLAREWQVPVSLTHVIHERRSGTRTVQYEAESAETYLSRMSAGFAGPVHNKVLRGPTVEALVEFARSAHITDLVMASHGHTGVTRTVVGSVAYELIHRLTLPVLVVPAASALGREPDSSTE